MKPFLARKKPSRTQARNAALMNQFATPGLGSLLAGRWVAGSGQLFVFLAGFMVYCTWAWQNLSRYYSLMFSDAPPASLGWNRLAWIGVALCVVAWCWSLVTSLSLIREAAKISLESPGSFAAGQTKLAEAKIISALAALPQWRRTGEVISRTFQFKDFPAAMDFVNAVASLAEQAQHHPDLDVRWNRVTLALTTHDAGGLTEKDFALARQCDALAARPA
jgi:4a-hydroxytetrahydrobiopterin dehydratase